MTGSITTRVVIVKVVVVNGDISVVACGRGVRRKLIPRRCGEDERTSSLCEPLRGGAKQRCRIERMSGDPRALLIRQLQRAYSGELAAAAAYHGHAASVRSPEERAAISNIEAEELHHRQLVGELLAQLDAAPDPRLERKLGRIGRTLGALCHLSGWLAPMWGAGMLESHNIKEYEDAAQYAVAAGRSEMIDCLLHMAEVEWEHELYFRTRVESHFFAKLIPIWKKPPAKEEIRRKFASAHLISTVSIPAGS